MVTIRWAKWRRLIKPVSRRCWPASDWTVRPWARCLEGRGRGLPLRSRLHEAPSSPGPRSSATQEITFRADQVLRRYTPPDVPHHNNSSHRPGERSEPERAETEPNPRRTNSLQHRCFYSGRIVRQTRVEFRPLNPEGSRELESAPLRQAVPISRYSPLESPNSARQRLISNVNGSGENHIPANDARFASKVSVGKFGATVWAGRRKELGRTNAFENL